MTAHVLAEALFIVGLAASGGQKRIRLQRTQAAKLPFSDAVWAGDTLYLSGHIGLEPDTGRPPTTATEEARLVMQAFRETIEAAGLTMDDVVSIQVFCSDVSLFAEFNKVYCEFFPNGFPARAFLGSGKLLFDARFEVQGTALRR